MSKVLIVLLALFLSVSTCQRKVENKLRNLKMITYKDTLSRKQIDSLFITDTLSFDIEHDWIQSSSIIDDTLGKYIAYKYVYIKNLTDSTGVIYTLYTYQDSLFIINKKVIEQ